MSWRSASLALLPLLALAALAVTLSAASAGAEPLRDKKNYFEVGSTGWTFTVSEKSESKERMLATASHESGDARAALVRVNFPNTPAWRKKKYYFDDVVGGLKEATPGFVLDSRKQSKIGRVPILDVRYRRDHETASYVSVRFVFFRTFTLIISVQSDRRQRAAAGKLARSLRPFF